MAESYQIDSARMESQDDVKITHGSAFTIGTMLSEPDILQTLMKWRTRVSAAAWVVVRDAHAAEDVFQNAALKAMPREVSFENESALMSWAFITARPK